LLAVILALGLLGAAVVSAASTGDWWLIGAGLAAGAASIVVDEWRDRRRSRSH